MAFIGGPKQNPAGLPPNYFVKRSEEHTSELQSLMRISYAVFCLKTKIICRNNLSHKKTLQLKPIHNITTNRTLNTKHLSNILFTHTKILIETGALVNHK